MEIVKKEEFLGDAKKFFSTNKKKVGEAMRKAEKIIYVSFEDLAAYSPQLSEFILEKPEEAMVLLEQALEESLLIKNPRIRFTDLPENSFVKIRNIRAKHLNNLMWIEGIIRQASDVRPQVVSAKFECPSCGTIISVLQLEKKFKEPSRCSCGRKGFFKLVSKQMVDAQRLVIEESPDALIGGEQPRRINVFLKEDLVEPKMEEKTTPGAKVRVFGVLNEVPVPLPTGSFSTRFDLAVDANNVMPLEETYEDLQISEEDETQIKELSLDSDIFNKLSQTIAPSIYGHEKIKQALVLQLFGGVKKKKADGSASRGDIHILLVGDPGVAKSVILKFISTIAPKGRYVVGKSASGAGLTATVVRDEFLKGWSLEAGAMVLSNKGIVCIDEIEKMDQTDRSAMHEALEQQCMLPDFKLTFADGRSVDIGSFVDGLLEKNKKQVYKGKDCEILPVENIKLISTDFNTSFPINAVRVSRHIAPKEFVKIQLTNGKEIIVTPEHPCWIVENGKITTIPAEKLNPKMFFPIPSKIKIQTIPYKIENDYLCKILGYHLSDGCYELNRGKKTGIQFWNNNKLLIDDYKNSIEKYFKLNPIITTRNHQFAVRVISKKVVEEFNKLDKGLMEKGDIKKIPSYVMQLPNENIKYLLRALFDGDGTVVFQKRNGCRASLSSQNRQLLEQVSDLLLRFEIQSSIFQDKTGHVWILDISGQENLSRFLMNISFLSQHKKQRLKEYCEKNKTYRTIKDVVPGCTDKISKIFKKLRISMRKEIGHSIDLGVEKQRIFLQKLVSVAEIKLNSLLKEKPNVIADYGDIIYDLSEIKKLAFGYARWMKIKSVEKVKNNNIPWVYDVTVEPYHTFISNGMILHNTVTISKANVQASLRSETSVLAAGNPKFGRFDPYQAIASQVDIQPTLLNRFDVIFMLRDLPDKIKDEAIAMHVLAEHQNPSQRGVIDVDLFRKYIAYAKQSVHPKLTDEAVEEIKNFYVTLRNAPVASDSTSRPIPITARQLDALIRLSEASAKTRLSDKVERMDSQRAIELLKYYMMQAGYDYETKSFDIDKIATGITSSKRGKILQVKEVISNLESKIGKPLPIEEVENELKGKMTAEEITEALDKLRLAGDIFQPKKGFIQKV
ncbi:MAG: LAGLIDADG family homing endonuclease [Candidatus Pacearchaeota archaeon]